MEVREKLDQGVGIVPGENYLEIDLTEDEIENLARGKYPYIRRDINGKEYVISVGLKLELQRGPR